VLDRTSLSCIKRGTKREDGVTGLEHAPPEIWLIVENEFSCVTLNDLKRHMWKKPRDMRRTALRAAEPVCAFLECSNRGTTYCLQLWRSVL
jgi:hypothetical protein